ncbi:MAG: hypothetical protein ACRCTI_00625 [Beijerinckiaceae bacterium]
MALRVVAFAAVIALSACTPSTAPDDNRRLLPPRGGVVEGSAARMVRLGPFSGLNDDCSVASYAGVRVISQPANGTLRVVRGSGVATFGANNAFARCNGSPIRGTFAIYTANPGYQGPEAFSVEVRFADGERRTISPRFTVPAE